MFRLFEISILRVVVRRVRLRNRLLMAITGMLVALTSCKNTAPVEGETRSPPLHRNWWNYYERGVKAADSGQWGNARRDFEVCLGIRSGAKYGYPREQWKARIYGVQFVNDYFPHRELGIALFKLGQTQAASLELEESLRQEPSGRAKYYLNEAIGALQANCTLPAPVITLDDTSDASVYSREHAIRVSGRVSAEGRVGRIEVGGVPEFIELAETNRRFAKEVPLKSGTNTIRIVASDLNGRKTETTFQRIADWQKPTLFVRDLVERGGLLTVECSVRDDFAIRSVDLKNTRLPMKQTRQGADSVALSIACSADERPILEVTDDAGNILHVDLHDTLSRLPQKVASQPSGGIGFAGTFHAAPLWLLNDFFGTRPMLLSALPASADVPRDTIKPTLRLATEGDCVRVCVPEFYVEGEAGDLGGLASVTVNGQEYLRPSDKGSVCITFGGRLPLDPGSNRFDVVAEDVSGNRHERKFVVVCSEPEYREAEYRLAAGIPPFYPQGNNWAWQARARLQKEFTRLPVRFRLLERDEGWDYILRELGLTVNDLADPRAALRVGKMLSAELLFVGVVLEQGGGMTVQVRAVDSTDGSVILSSDVYAEKPERDLAYQVGGLFLKLLQGFPIAECRILDLMGDTASIDIGSSQGVRVGAKFIVLRDGDSGKGTADGGILSVANRPVSLEVDRPSKDASRVRVSPPEAAKLLQKGDRVYAR